MLGLCKATCRIDINPNVIAFGKPFVAISFFMSGWLSRLFADAMSKKTDLSVIQ